MRVVLKAGRERRLENVHPWVFANDVLRVEDPLEPGVIGDVFTEQGAFVGRGYVNAGASIPVRLLTRERREIDLSWYRERLRAAFERRAREASLTGTEAVRLVHAEADGLPGLIVDRFAAVLMVQLRNAGLELHRELVVEALRLEAPRLETSRHGVKGDSKVEAAFERSDTAERSKEGIGPRVGPLWGELPDSVRFREDGIEFFFDPLRGQKTGFYLDQRENRRRLAGLLDSSSRVLDVYSYIGAFSLHAARAGASALAVDKDPVALGVLEQSARVNGLAERVGMRLGDALEVLDALVREGRRFTHAVIDPPTLAKRKDEVVAAKRIFTIATKNVLRMLEPGGVVVVSTCAFHLKIEDLIEAVRMAGGDAGRKLEVMDITFQPADHPWILQIPESLYLKTLFLRAD